MKRTILLPIFAAVIASAGFAQYNPNATVATVQYNKTEGITARQLRTRIELLEQQGGGAFNAQQRQEVLEALIDERLILQAAAKDKMTVSEAELNRQVQGMRQQIGAQLGKAPTDAEFNEIIKSQTGLDITTWREQMRDQMTMQRYNQKYLADVLPKANIRVSDAEVNEQIQQLKNQLAAQAGREPTEAEFAAAVRQQTGMELAAFRTEIKNTLAQQKYLLQLGGGEPTDDEIGVALRANPANYRQDGFIQSNCIVIPFTSSNKAKAKETADKLVREIGSSGEEFLARFIDIRGGAAASRYPGAQAGVSYFLQSDTLATMGKDFFDTAFPSSGGDTAGVKKVSKLIETPQAYCILYILKREKARDLGLSDRIPEYLGAGQMTIRDYIYAGLTDAGVQAGSMELHTNMTNDLRKSATIRTFPQNINW